MVLLLYGNLEAYGGLEWGKNNWYIFLWVDLEEEGGKVM